MLVCRYRRNAEVFAAHATSAAAMHFISGKNAIKRGSRYGAPTNTRRRRTIQEIYMCLGAKYFQRAYRMSYESFWKLHEKLKEGIVLAHKQYLEKMRRQRRARRSRSSVCGRRRLNSPAPPPIPNGKIESEVRLACALRYFAGGSPYDIMAKYGMSHSEVMNSVWYVVEASNTQSDWYISYPESHEEQLRIAMEFKDKSSVDFEWCAGAIDGIIIWMNRPTLKEAAKVGVDQQKFFCGRKHKFGLNCQAVCDVRGMFLDISITHGASAADCLAFENSELYKRLQKGVLAEDLILFGDNAYINSIFMATPYPNTSGGSNDNYNFYHSQLRIRIECAFGMLVQRWGILRMAMPIGITVKKTIALVNCLAKLHNFCIEEVDAAAEGLREDDSHIQCSDSGYVPMVTNNTIRDVLGAEVQTPDSLIGGGDNFDEVPLSMRRDRTSASAEFTLPRTKLCKHVEDMHMVRPVSNRRY
ncbi:hypothetical protein HJC23_002484 [Cyclotella cryptica]|uniref:DDE Tnp4 domain-containing protein n=1 Tax=Cyclotella cryptica TaxID=29204 RepID=A0ABD3PDR4_9STRA|eukprot:CCRYP_015392-RA/>CCRYP_015392-RA protein AED:0.03 eAED:-0.03 QI:0/-1/0/1/-1/1/1/0/470